MNNTRTVVYSNNETGDELVIVCNESTGWVNQYLVNLTEYPSFEDAVDAYESL